MLKLLRIGGSRVRDDRGSVGVLVALAMFFVMGMLAMTFNTARMSTEKMRLQNAVDAAALEHAAWQARGMNMIQNLNNEAFTGLLFADELIIIATAINVVRAVFEGVANAHIVFISAFMRVLEMIAYGVIKAMLFIATWIAKGLVGGVITVLQTICMFTPLIGYFTAQELAQKNGARPAGGNFLQIGDIHFGAYSIGVNVKSPLSMFKLPVEKEQFKGMSDEEKAPFVTDNGKFKRSIELANVLSFRTDLAESVPAFDFHPYVSTKLKKPKGNIKWELPSPTVWISYKGEEDIRLMPLSVWDKGFTTVEDQNKGLNRLSKRFRTGHGAYGHMIALGAAQCVSGDIVKQSVTAKKDSFCIQRPAGLGAGATAKLVPVANALSETFFGEFIYH